MPHTAHTSMKTRLQTVKERTAQSQEKHYTFSMRKKTKTA